MSKRQGLIFGLALALSAGSGAAEPEKDIYKGRLEDRVAAMASIQPGLGVVMHEIGWRFANVYWAANGGNWRLAQYQLKELIEASEVGEVTRPARGEMLKAFEEANLEALTKSLEQKNLEAFNQHFTEAVQGCNACHTALGMGYIHYQVPDQPAMPVLDFNLKTEPKTKGGS